MYWSVNWIDKTTTTNIRDFLDVQLIPHDGEYIHWNYIESDREHNPVMKIRSLEYNNAPENDNDQSFTFNIIHFVDQFNEYGQASAMKLLYHNGQSFLIWSIPSETLNFYHYYYGKIVGFNLQTSICIDISDLNQKEPSQTIDEDD